jgi:hypothetical protein
MKNLAVMAIAHDDETEMENGKQKKETTRSTSD